MRIRNFLFHRVSDEVDSIWPPMKPELFERIIAQLVKEYTIVPLEKYLEDSGSFKTTKKIATILFDDGYKDNIEIAAPILSKFKCPASFYVTSDCIDRNIPTWTYIVDYLLSRTRKEVLNIEFDFVPGELKKIYLATFYKKNNSLKPWLKNLDNVKRIKVLNEIIDQCDDVQPPSDKMMNWNEVCQLANAGFSIGSHSHTHPLLAKLQDEKEIEVELELSAQKIQLATGVFPKTISYPIGSFDHRVTKIAKMKGYQYGLAVEQRFYNPQKNSLFEIPRVELHQEPWWKVQMRMKGIYSAIKKITG